MPAGHGITIHAGLPASDCAARPTGQDYRFGHAAPSLALPLVVGWLTPTPTNPDIAGMSFQPTAEPVTGADPSAQPVRAALHWLAQARPRRVICLVVGLWILNTFDLLLTLTASRQRLLHELNPVAAHMLEAGEGYLVLYKFGLIAIASYSLLRFRRERITEYGAVFALVVYGFVAIHWRNCYDFYAETTVTSEHPVLLDPLTSFRGD